MQVITGVDCTRQGPFLFIAPYIGSHDEELDGSFTQDTCIDALEPLIEPAYLQADKINLQVDKGGGRGKTKIELTDRVRITGVRPWSDEQFTLASFRRTALLTHDLKIVDGIFEKDIVPAANVEAWSGDVLMLTKNSHRFDLVVFAI